MYAVRSERSDIPIATAVIIFLAALEHWRVDAATNQADRTASRPAVSGEVSFCTQTLATQVALRSRVW